MTSFDQLKSLQRIAALLRERGREVTLDEVLCSARMNAEDLRLSLADALEAMEDDLLSHPPDLPRYW